MTNTKQYSGRVSRVGPAYAIESVGIRFMIEGHNQSFRVDLVKVNNNFGMTKIGDLVSFKFKETGVFKKEFVFDEFSFINHTIENELKALNAVAKPLI